MTYFVNVMTYFVNGQRVTFALNELFSTDVHLEEEHYSGITWAILATQLFVQQFVLANNKGRSECCITGPLWGNTLVDSLHKWSVMQNALPRHDCVINSLGPSDAIWRQRSGSTLAQVMACCLTAPSHYLNQSWLIISKVEWHSSKGKFTRDTSAINHWNYLEN